MATPSFGYNLYPLPTKCDTPCRNQALLGNSEMAFEGAVVVIIAGLWLHMELRALTQLLDECELAVSDPCPEHACYDHNNSPPFKRFGFCQHNAEI